jgi:hypothetical protein
MRRGRLAWLLGISLLILSAAEIWMWLDTVVGALLILVIPLIYFIISFLLFILIDPGKNAPIPYLFTRGLGFSFCLKLASVLMGYLLTRLFTDHVTPIIPRLTSGAFLIIAMVAISLLIYQFWNKFRQKTNDDDDVILDQPMDQ